MPTLMISIDDIENITEPNHLDAQQNLHSPTPMKATVLAIFKEPSEDDSTNKRFNFLSLFFSFHSVL